MEFWLAASTEAKVCEERSVENCPLPREGFLGAAAEQLARVLIVAQLHAEAREPGARHSSSRPVGKRGRPREALAVAAVCENP